MKRIIKQPKKDIGASMNDLIFRGHRKQEEVYIRIIDIDSNNLLEDSIEALNKINASQNEKTIAWLNIDGHAK